MLTRNCTSYLLTIFDLLSTLAQLFITACTTANEAWAMPSTADKWPSLRSTILDYSPLSCSICQSCSSAVLLIHAQCVICCTTHHSSRVVLSAREHPGCLRSRQRAPKQTRINVSVHAVTSVKYFSFNQRSCLSIKETRGGKNKCLSSNLRGAKGKPFTGWSLVMV